MNIYILQKDLPDAPKGTEFEFDGRNTYFYLSPDRSYRTIPYQFVERNPTWFLPKGMEEFKEAKDKPPLGLMPKYLHDEKRFEDIRNAMGRYTDVGKVVPQEWIEEEKELLKVMKNRHDSALANKERIKNDAERFFHRSCDVMKIEIDKSAIYFQKGDEGFAFDAQYIFKKLAGI